jgi:hypothetical protein
VTYLLVGAALALFRVSLLAWVEHRSVTHGMTEAVYNLLWGLRREGFLGEYTPVGAIHFESDAALPVKVAGPAQASPLISWGPPPATVTTTIAGKTSAMNKCHGN